MQKCTSNHFDFVLDFILCMFLYVNLSLGIVQLRSVFVVES